MASNLCSQKHFPFRKRIRVGKFHELTASTDICPFILHLFDLALVSHAPFLRRSFCPPLLVGFPEGNQIRNFPEPIRSHCALSEEYRSGLLQQGRNPQTNPPDCHP